MLISSKFLQILGDNTKYLLSPQQATYSPVSDFGSEFPTMAIGDLITKLNPKTFIRLAIIGVLVTLVIFSSQYETVNQFYNGFWTLFCLCVHPATFYLLFLLIRWSPMDSFILRRQFCKNGTEKPNERFHMAIVIFLYQVGCFGQYASCALLWIYTKHHRPSRALTILNYTTLAAGLGANMYMKRGPLGRGEDQDSLESQAAKRKPMFVRKDGMMQTEKPEWQGGLFDLMDDPKIACLSFSCPCCVYGWNMGRIHLGNSHHLKLAFLAVSIVFCVVGLLFGGHWRIKMKTMYDLPDTRMCCGSPNVADRLQWLFCPCCSLAQEARTIDFYEVIITDGNPPLGNGTNGNTWKPPPTAPPPTAPPPYYQDSNLFQGQGDGLRAPASANMQRGEY
ncbi:PLANT CADMIUM RESISTANCE 7-like protein [Drosera capensis]